VTLIAAPPKLGKTTLTCGLFTAVLRGQPFLDRETVQTGCLLLTEERSTTLATKDIRWRLSEAGLHVLLRHETGGASWPEVVAEATQYALANGIGVLCVDTFAAWGALTGESENASGAVLEQIAPLQAAAAEGLAVLLVAHVRKGGGEHGEGIRGSNAIPGAVDVVLELRRPKGVADETIRVLHGLSRFDETPSELVLALTDDGYETRPDLAATKAEGERVRVLAIVDRLGRAEAQEVAEEAEMTKATASRYLSELYNSEAIGREGKGVKGNPFVFVSSTADPLGGQNELSWGDAE
jgi:hypothetical protein